MNEASPLRFDTAQALDESLAAWCGWFSNQPLPSDLANLVEQLEAAYLRADRRGAAEA